MVIAAAWCLVAGHPGFVFNKNEQTPAQQLENGGIGGKNVSGSGEMSERDAV